MLVELVRHRDLKKKIISASRVLREFIDSLKFVKKCQLSNEPTVDYLRQIVESQLLLFITKKITFFYFAILNN